MKPLAFALLVAVLVSPLASAMILVKIPGVPGDATIQGYDNGEWFVADSFSFGVERELSTGPKGGTEDINIGVGELQVVNISKGLGRASAKLMQFAINGNTAGQAEIRFVTPLPGPTPQTIVYAIYKLDRCFVKSWSTSGDADDRPTEEVAFYYNRIAFRFYHTDDGVTFVDGGLFAWDAVTSTLWSGHNLPTTPPPPPAK